MEKAWICLEFTKTRGWEARDRTDDALTDYGALARWVYEAGGGSAEVIAALEVAAAERDADVHFALSEAGSGVVHLKINEPGEYAFYCSVPGHREGGMEGTLIVN